MCDLNEGDITLAIVGTSCRFPGGITDLGELWAALLAGRDLVGVLPPDRFDTRRLLSNNPRRRGKTYTTAAGVLQEVAGFDAGYFGVSPRAAAQMDPQHRLLLELAAEALDDAGVDVRALSGSDTGVFVGVGARGYGMLQATRLAELEGHSPLGTMVSNAANRISHFFDLHGPSLVSETACSSSLVAVHLACETLRQGRSRVVLAGGANILISPDEYVSFARAAMLSPRGLCQSFSANADGYVRGEGGGMVVLKRLADAIEDGDRIHAVIRGTGTNNDGHTAGISMPSATAQQALLEEVYGRAGVNADDLVYIEAHGTGTPVGDPIECEALGLALGQHRRTAGALPIGSVKTNMGHLEPASGMPGLFKALLVLRHGVIPASLHATPVSAAINFDVLGLTTVPSAHPVEIGERSVCGVNSFGLGGSNAHVILAPPPSPLSVRRSRSGGTLPLVVTAQSPEALAEACWRMAERLSVAEAEEFYDLAYTAARRRGRLTHTATVLAASAQEAAERLFRLATQDEDTPASVIGAPVSDGRPVFVFSGNGSQWAGMGADLLVGNEVFRKAVEEVDALSASRLGFSVVDELRTGSAERLRRTEVAQPLLFAVQVGLVALLADRGLRPAAVVAHSVGEIGAAFTAGILDLETACRVVAERSRAQGTTAGTGRMAAVGLTPDEAAIAMGGFQGHLTVAGVNSDRDVTIAGPLAALEKLREELRPQGVFFRMLDLDYAFHSSAMDGIESTVRLALHGIEPRRGVIPFASAVTGSMQDGRGLDAEYWWANIRRPVLFADAVRQFRGAGFAAFVEIGAHPVLSTYLRRLTGNEAGGTAVIPTLVRDRDGSAALDLTVARAIASDLHLDWDPHFPHQGNVRDLPSYPWQRERHWHGAPTWWVQRPAGDATGHPLLGDTVPGPDPVWESSIDQDQLPWLGDHKVGETVLMPGAGFAEMALAAAARTFQAPVEITDLEITTALAIPWDEDTVDLRVQTTLAQDDGTLRIFSQKTPSSPWQQHVRARARRLLREQPVSLDMATLRENTPIMVGSTEHYARLARAGLTFGPAFHVLETLRVGQGEVVAYYALAAESTGFDTHPIILDGALQSVSPLLPALDDGLVFLPVSVGAVRSWHSVPSRGVVHMRIHELTENEAICHAVIADHDGVIAMEMEGVRLKGITEFARAAPRSYTTVLRAAGLVEPSALASSAPLITESTKPERAALFANWHAGGQAQFAPRLEILAGHFFIRAVGQLLPGATGFTLAQLRAAGLRPDRVLLVESLAEMAREAGLLAPEDTVTPPQTWRVAESPDPDSIIRMMAAEFPAEAAVLALFGMCGADLAAFLRGELDPVEVLFNEHNRSLIEQFYHCSTGSRLAADVIRLYLRDLVASWPADRPLNVLEVGGGTGGTTASLLPLLPPERTRYVFTDVSSGFFPRAQQRFAEFDFVEYRTLDLGEDPLLQGFTEGEFDLVVGANVLHIPSDVRNTMTHVATLLADHGSLLAIESTNLRAFNLCFGLFDGFWEFTDHELRTRSCLQPAKDWVRLLPDCGFGFATYGGEDIPQGESDQAVILAARASRAEPAATIPSPRAIARWVIAAEQPHAPLVTQLASALTGGGSAPVVMPPDDPDQWDRVLGSESATGIVLMLDDDPADPERKQTSLTGRILDRASVIRAFAIAYNRREDTAPFHFTLVTRPSGALPGPERPSAPEDAAMWGVARSLANDEAGLRVRRVSLERGPNPSDDARRLATVINSASEEDEIVLTRNGCFVPRTVARTRASSATALPAGSPYVLQVSQAGTSPRLDWVQRDPREPAPGEVMIEVRAAALNYIDVMLTTNTILFEGASGGFGKRRVSMECAGTVTRVGTGTEGFAPGDRVFAYAPSDTMGSHATTSAHLVGHLPDDLSFTEAATLPVVFATVHHSLVDRARLRPGETILVHGGAGGVGLAAVQFAARLGARVVATAGTHAKRQLLRHLGVEHVLDSRSLRFAEQIRILTAGQGVDVVLNAIAGEAMTRSLELLRPGGRFVEMGARDLYANSSLPLKTLLHNRSYLPVDVYHVICDEPVQGEELVSEIAGHVQRGDYRPIPHSVYPAARVHEAFALLQHSRHIGKVVISFDQQPLIHPAHKAPRLDPDSSYLITGGLGGFGATTARHLATLGARHLSLVGRRGGVTPEAAQLLADLRGAGVEVQVHAADVADADAMRAVINAARAPLRGVIHSAMVLENAALRDMTAEQFRDAMAVKAEGGFLLDALTDDLDLFVVYSSLSALIGGPGQANYNAGNLYLEALTRARRHSGRPAIAVGWGALAETGFVARAGLETAMSRLGIDPFTPAEALSALNTFLADTREDVVTFSRCDWERLSVSLATGNVPRHEKVRPDTATETADAAQNLGQRIATLSATEATDLVADALSTLLAHLLLTPADRVDRASGLDRLGVDSLMATELVVSVRERLSCEITTLEVLNSSSINELAHRLLVRLGHSGADPVSATMARERQGSS